MIIFSALLVIFITTLMGIVFWDGMDYLVMSVPASLHDIAFFFVLFATYIMREHTKYIVLVACFVAGSFYMQSVMQVYDIRPPGYAGQFSLYLDIIVYGLYTALFLAATWSLAVFGDLGINKRLLFFSAVLVFFLACNFLVATQKVRQILHNYETVYDVIYYLCMYLVVISCADWKKEHVHNSLNNIANLLHFRRLHIR